MHKRNEFINDLPSKYISGLVNTPYVLSGSVVYKWNLKT